MTGALTNTLPLCLGVLLATGLSIAPPGHAQDATTSAEKPPKEIIAIETRGKRPGPPLWQVSNGRNTVWIFGIPSPYHKDDYRWDRMSVRAIMEEADVFIPAPEIQLPSNPIKMIQLTKEVARMTFIPDKGKLEDILAPELFERYLQARENYWPRKKKALLWRPHTAGQNLYVAALHKAGLVPGIGTGQRSRISKTVENIARSKGVEIHSMHQTWEPDEFREVVDNMEWDIDCLEAALDSLDTDIEAMIARSHAWANGDVSAFRKYDYPHTELACQPDVPEGQSALFKNREALRTLWLDAIDDALVNYKSTFSTMSIDDLVRPGGLLEELVHRGYSVRIL